MRDIRALAAYFVREISARAASFEGLPLHIALEKATTELRPEIEASLKAANLTVEEMAEAMRQTGMSHA